MKVKIANKIYEMGKKEYHGILNIASEQVPFGIYAAEKRGYAELLNLKCSSKTQLKNAKQKLKLNGFKVFANERI